MARNNSSITLSRTVIARKVEFLSDGLTLCGTIFSSARASKLGSQPAILIVHGWKGSERGYETVARLIASLGATVFTFNLRGHGNSDGEKYAGSRAEYVRDICMAYRFLLNQPGIDRRRIVGMGSSLGCYLISRALSRCRFVALVFRAPATYSDRGFKARFAPQVDNDLKTFRRIVISPQKNVALRRLSLFRGHLLIISGGQDQDVPSQTIASYHSAASRAATVTDRLYSTMGHIPTLQQYGYINRLLFKWFADLLVQ